VAREMAWGSIPVLILPREQQRSLETGTRVRIGEDGSIEVPNLKCQPAV